MTSMFDFSAAGCISNGGKWLQTIMMIQVVLDAQSSDRANSIVTSYRQLSLIHCNFEDENI
jgi:hypothetical protein